MKMIDDKVLIPSASPITRKPARNTDAASVLADKLVLVEQAGPNGGLRFSSAIW